jgi:hypothetical protein
MRSLTDFKILPVTLFRGLVPTFRKPPVTLKDVPKAARDSVNKIFPKAGHECTLGENQP